MDSCQVVNKSIKNQTEKSDLSLCKDYRDHVIKSDFICRKSHGSFKKYQKNLSALSSLKRYSFSESDCGDEILYGFYLRHTKCVCKNQQDQDCKKRKFVKCRWTMLLDNEFNTSSIQWIDHLKAFRQSNWFDCHAQAKSKYKKGGGLKVTDCQRQQDEVRCILNDRMFLVPIGFESKPTKNGHMRFLLSPEIKAPKDFPGPCDVYAEEKGKWIINDYKTSKKENSGSEFLTTNNKKSVLDHCSKGIVGGFHKNNPLRTSFFKTLPCLKRQNYGFKCVAFVPDSMDSMDSMALNHQKGVMKGKGKGHFSMN